MMRSGNSGAHSQSRACCSGDGGRRGRPAEGRPDIRGGTKAGVGLSCVHSHVSPRTSRDIAAQCSVI